MAATSPSTARLPSAIIILVLLGATAALLRSCLSVCEGRFVYPLDDTYIHMTMARNLASHGSWGITPGAFEPASSSPLWTLMLAGLIRLFGVQDAWPLALAVLCMVALVVILEKLLRDPIPEPLARSAVLLLIPPAIGLPGLAFTGMEPVLHGLLVLLLAWSVARRLTTSGPGRLRGEAAIAALAVLSVLTRFESLFLIASLSAAALIRRRPLTAVALMAGGGGALAGYVAFALPQGGPWLPSSVVLNGPLIHPRLVDPLAPLARRIPEAFLHERHELLPALFLTAGWLLLPRRAIVSRNASIARLLLAVLVPTLLLHLQLALVDSFFRRYEAYLFAVGALGVVVALASGLGGLPDGLAARLPRVPALATAVLVGVGFATPFVFRGLQLARWTPRAARNIYQQQFQMARFVREHFRDGAVAINDLGALSYYGDARVVDLCGLGTAPIARAMLEKRYDTAFIERFCAAERVELAMIYESWFAGRVTPPRRWARIARWTLRDNVIAGDATVTLFATDPATARRVRAAARAFAATLPQQVVVQELP